MVQLASILNDYGSSNCINLPEQWALFKHHQHVSG